MMPKRKRTKATERFGINYVRNIVENNNSLFHEIDLGSDLGNDAHVEFTQGEDATGCCIAVQIKSGESYVSASKSQFTIRSDRQHFNYWNSHTLPICAIVVDPARNIAVWFDVTRYLRENPQLVTNGPYSIHIPAASEFSADTFQDFRDHFLQYKGDNDFGLAIDRFADTDDVEGCLDGIRSLFSFHRQRRSSWYIVVNCFRNFRGHPLLRELVIILGHVPGHGDIFWHKGNIIGESTRKYAERLIRERFSREECLALLEVIDEYGFGRGTIGQYAHSLITIIREREQLLHAISFDAALAEDTRCAALWLLVDYLQRRDAGFAIARINHYLQMFPHSEYSEDLKLMAATIKEFGHVGFY